MFSLGNITVWHAVALPKWSYRVKLMWWPWKKSNNKKRAKVPKYNSWRNKKLIIISHTHKISPNHDTRCWNICFVGGCEDGEVFMAFSNYSSSTLLLFMAQTANVSLPQLLPFFPTIRRISQQCDSTQRFIALSKQFFGPTTQQTKKKERSTKSFILLKGTWRNGPRKAFERL